MDISQIIASIEAASEGSELRQPIIDGLNAVNTHTLPAVSINDAGKLLKVSSEGTWEVSSEGYMPIPSATLSITSNNTYDVKNYSNVEVNVPGIVPTGTIQIDSSGTYDVAQYAFAEVSQQSGATLIQKTITENGTYNAISDSADGYSEVIVNVSGNGLSFETSVECVASIVTVLSISFEFSTSVEEVIQ